MADLTEKLVIEMVADQGNVIAALEAVNKKLGSVEKVMERLASTTKKASVQMDRNMKDLNKSMMQVSKTITDKFGNAVKGMLGMLGVGGFVGTMRKAIEASEDFEDQMRGVGLLLGDSAKEDLPKFEKAIRSLAMNSTKSVGELTQALKEVMLSNVKGGRSVEGAMSIMDASMKMAKISGVSLGQATGTLSQLLLSFKMDASDAGTMVDKLAVAFKNGRGSMAELANGMAGIGVFAHNIGVKMDDLSAATVALGKSGLDSGTALFQLRALMVQLVNPSDKLRMLIKRMGFESAEAAIAQKGLLGIMQALNKETGGNSEKVGNYIKNWRALNAAVTLSGDGLKDFEQTSKDVINSMGEGAKLAEKMSDPMDKAIGKVKNTIHDMFIDLGEKLAPVVLEKLEELSDWFKENRESIVDTLKTFAGVVISFGKFILENGKAIAIAMAAWWAVNEVNDFIDSFDRLVGNYEKFSSWMATASAPAGVLALFGAGIAAAALAAEYLARKLDDARKAGIAMGIALKDATSRVDMGDFESNMGKSLAISGGLIGKAGTGGIEGVNAAGAAKAELDSMREQISRMRADVLAGKKDMDALNQMRQAWADKTGEDPSKMPFTQQTMLKARTLMLSTLDEYAAKATDVQYQIESVYDKIFYTREGKFATLAGKEFEITKAMLDAIALYRKSGMDALNAKQLKDMDLMYKNEAAIESSLEKEQYKDLLNYGKARAKALEDAYKKGASILLKLEEENASEMQKIFNKHHEDQEALREVAFKNEKDRQKAIALLAKKFEKEFHAQSLKNLQIRVAAENKVAEAKNALLDMRAEASAKLAKKITESDEYVKNLKRDLMTPEDRAMAEHKDKLIGIERMTFETAAQKEKAIKLEEERFKKTYGDMGFWSKVATGFAERLGARLLDYAVAVADVLTTPFSALADVFTGLMGGMSNVAGAGLGKITGIFNEILGGGKGVADVKTMTQSAVEFFKQLAKQLPAALAWFARVGVPQIINAFVESLPDVINAIVEAIPIIIDSLISNLDKIIMPFVEGILTLIPALIQRIPDVIAAIIELIPQVMAAVIKAIPSMAGSLFTGALKILPSALLGFVKGIGKMIDAFTTKDRAETAQKAKTDIINESVAAGYSEEEAGALGEQIYEVVMGRGKDIKELADYWYDQAYTAEMKKSGDIEKAKAAGEKKREEVVAFYKKLSPNLTDSSKEKIEPSIDQNQVGYDSSLANPYARPSTQREDSIDQADKTRKADKKNHPLEDPVKVATVVYENMLKDLLGRIDADWITEEKFLKLQGMTPAQIKKAKKTFIENARTNAYTAARAEYDRVFNQVTEDNKKNPNYIPEKKHSGGYIMKLSDLNRAFRAHSGTVALPSLAADEVPIIAQAGEAIMNRNWVQNAGGKKAIDQMNRTGQPNGGNEKIVNNVYVEHMMSTDTAKVVDGMISGNLRSGSGKLYEKLNSGRVVGYKTRRAV